MQRHTAYLYLETALHVLGGTSIRSSTFSEEEKLHSALPEDEF
jgi:hypothetical protein